MSWTAGDWMCPACQNQNFKKRDACQNCGYPRYGGPDPSSWQVVRLGDWYCTAMNFENHSLCGAHNFASRSNCYICGSRKQEGGPTKPGDWTCPRLECGVHNYAKRTECFKCKAPKGYGGGV
ncbi:hypothetical protein Patl1_13109 [Pistacia atlantica]|uniref:Uncharacterized protein n=1 Tax=Pistacia atlantica TaxID=434234 RepID=A0ACC1AS48_9ROSI|nr:hypothetical protein Patl1_13109 [Pistacia atlantica]